MEGEALLRELHDRAWRSIEAGESGFAIAHISKDGQAGDVSFHKGHELVGTYHGGPQGLRCTELAGAMMLSIAEGRLLECCQKPGAASPRTFYRMDIVRMIRTCRQRGEHREAELLEAYRARHPEVFVT
ncbi:MAG: hypothetical protein AAF637_04440 [Pseudomonadota bacterium]